ncbi:MAG: fibronectin type III domain-containing protein [Patescibacteria group bacterium]|nr:fibronectin type III domain-containing protein [Patescibacteria group bacterium]
MSFFKKIILISVFITANALSAGTIWADTTIYNFLGVTTTNHGANGYPIAIEHDSDVFPWTTLVEQNDSANPTDTEYSNISSDNSLQWATDDPGNNDEMAMTYRFFIQESISDISNIQIKWNGNTDGSLASNHSIWLRKNGLNEFGGTNTWIQLGSSLSIPQDTNTDLIRNLTTDFATYINGTSGQLEFVVTTDNDSEDMRTNYLEVVVTYTVTPPPDTTPPSSISNLSASNPTQTSIGLTWTAVGDDGSTGTATAYDIRYSTANITEANWSSATQVSGEPTPSTSGSSESMTVSGLTTDTTYYFAIKTSDEVPNISDISNITNATTNAVPPAPDTTAPSAISDLAASSPTQTSIDLNWTAVGDDGSTGTATSYDVRYSTAIITEANWSSAIQVSGEPIPALSGTYELMTVSNLDSEVIYYFAIKTTDDNSNTSDISNVINAQTNPVPNIVIPEAGGAGGGVAPTSVIFSGQAYSGSKIIVQMKDNLNPIYRNVPLSIYEMSDSGEFYISYTALLSGKYFLTLRARDRAGQETGTQSFSVDFTTDKKLEVLDIFMPPTVSFNQDLIRQVDPLTISGYSSPDSKIKLEIDDIIVGETKVDDSGSYLFNFEPGNFSLGLHYVRTKQILEDGTESNFSFPRTFKISSLSYPRADFNKDGTVDVVDWSIFLFRWGGDDDNLKREIDLDLDGITNIKDFSIFLKAVKI